MKKLSLVIIGLLFLSTAFSQSVKPNILVIIIDDHAYQTIDAYGANYGSSSNMNRLAREGMLFNRAFVANYICAPSRAILLTGKYSHMNGMRNQSENRFTITITSIPVNIAYSNILEFEPHVISSFVSMTTRISGNYMI